MGMKIYKLAIFRPAQWELEEIAALHMALSGSASAKAITERIYRSLEALPTFPLSGPQLKDRQLREAGYRFAVTDLYLSVYRLIEGTIYVYHIVDGRSNYPSLLQDLYQ